MAPTRVVWVAGAHGRLGQRILALLLHRGHHVRAVVRTEGQAEAMRSLGAEPRIADLRGDIEWTFEGCEAAVFAAGARHRGELSAIDAGGAAKAAEAATHAELSRFVLCSVIGAQNPEHRNGGVREFLMAKHDAEHRVVRLDMPWTILRFGRLTEQPGTGRIATRVRDGDPVTLNRDDAALTVVEALEREHLVREVVPVIDGDRFVAGALDAVEPHELPPAPSPPPRREALLGAAQSDNPPDAPDMIAPDAPPLDADVEWEGDGPVPPEPVGNDDPAPGIP
jgi:nucleoside-diphosphate-sugar epimerase